MDIATYEKEYEKRYFSSVMVLHALIARGEPLSFQTARDAYHAALMLDEVAEEIESDFDGAEKRLKTSRRDGHGL